MYLCIGLNGGVGSPHITMCPCVVMRYVDGILYYAIILVFFLFFRIGSMAIPIKQVGIKLHNEQVELLDSLCGQLRCTNSFFIRQLINNCSTELFERLTDIRLKNESHRLTALSNKSLLKSLKKPNSNIGKSHSPKD